MGKASRGNYGKVLVTIVVSRADDVRLRTTPDWKGSDGIIERRERGFRGFSPMLSTDFARFRTAKTRVTVTLRSFA